MITFRKFGKFGRFGSQLFQYTGTRLYAELNGFEWTFPDWIGNRVFELENSENRVPLLLPTIQLADIASTNWSERLLKPLGLWQRSSIEDLYKNPRDNISLYGYVEDSLSLRLLKEQKGRVLRWLKFKKEINDQFQKATDKYQPWTGLHIRRGDLVKRNLIVPLSAYHEFIEQQSLPGNIFIGTDDPNTKSEFAHLPLISLENPLPQIPDFVFDFWILTNAQAVIGCGSTFSWWAAYLGNKNSYFSPPLIHLWPKGYLPAITRQQI